MTGGEAEIALDADAIGQPQQGDFAERKEPEFGTAEPQIGEANSIWCGIYKRRIFSRHLWEARHRQRRK